MLSNDHVYCFAGMPQWTNRPENQEKSVDEKATFHCVAQYATQYMWYVNGVPVDDSTYLFGSAENLFFILF